MGHFGFSYIGFNFLLMLTVPNLIWTKHQPKEYDYQNENKVLLVFERVGQVCATCTALIFSNLNIQPWSDWSLWLMVSVTILGIGHIGIHLQHLREIQS